MTGPVPGRGIPLGRIAEQLGGTVEGSPDVLVTGVAGIEEAGEGDLTFVANPKYVAALARTRATAVLLAPALERPDGVTAVRVPDPYAAMMMVLRLFDPGPPEVAPGVHATAIVAADVTVPPDGGVGPYVVVERGVVLGAGTRIGAHGFVGEGAALGEACYLHPRVTVARGCRLGNRVVVHSGTVIGADGFGYAPVEGRYHKIPQLGIVDVGDDVEIGANSCIDRATMGATVIGRGTKIDNLVQVAHNARIGRDVAVAAQAGISGSTRVDDGARLGGQAGLVGHIHIGAGATIGAQAGVIGDIPAGETVSGYPARPHRQTLRAEATLRRLPELVKRLRALDPERKSTEEESS
ncbi:MAG TPA: UDP-3-O-(3-hydroxymyristoyl)glucosamine N-acyltransferase [bacterium]|nr:UDP-3-O-(3-hydroxymyristoyl)glucosamine N-acyltransferase [bacterium]